MTSHYYHPDYLRISTGFQLDDASTAEIVRDEYLPAMEEEARRCERAERVYLGMVRTVEAMKWGNRAEVIRRHIAEARERLRKAGVLDDVAADDCRQTGPVIR